MASTGWLKAPLCLDCLPPAIVWDQASPKQLMNELQGVMGKGGSKSAGGTADKNSKPPPRLKARPNRTRRGVELYMWVLEFCLSPCVRLLQKSQGGRSVPRPDDNPQAPKQHIKAATKKPVKEASGAALSAGSEASVAFCDGQKESLVEPSKKAWQRRSTSKQRSSLRLVPGRAR